MSLLSFLKAPLSLVRAAVILPFLLCSLMGASFAAPVVVTPGEASSFLYFPAGVTATGSSGSTSGLVGMIAAFSATPSSDWLVCDGSTIQATDYPELVEHLRGGPGFSSEVLPDYRGYFLRGWDSMGGSAAMVDAGRSLNSVQGDAIRNITGDFLGGGTNISPSGAFFFRQMDRGNLSDGGGNREDMYGFDASRQVPTADENRPKNISVIYAIRAK